MDQFESYKKYPDGTIADTFRLRQISISLRRKRIGAGIFLCQFGRLEEIVLPAAVHRFFTESAHRLGFLQPLQGAETALVQPLGAVNRKLAQAQLGKDVAQGMLGSLQH